MTMKTLLFDLKRLELGIANAVDFLHRHQLPYGEFKSYLSPHAQMLEKCIFDSTPFATALILYSLAFVESAKVEEMQAKALAFLKDEMEFPAIWRYRSSYNTRNRPIPPDLDDTCCVSYILEQHGIAFCNNKKLILANRNKEGLFYTWIAPRWTTQLNPAYWFVVLREALSFVRLYTFWQNAEAKPDDIDGVVNANVLLYLGESDTTKPVIDYLVGIIEEEKEHGADKWYLNRLIFYYMLSRAYFNGVTSLEVVKEEIIQRMIKLSAPNGAIGNPMETALAICTFLNFRCQPSVLPQAISYLLETQKPSGEWKKFVLYKGGRKSARGWGSEELSTGFCLEALARYQKQQVGAIKL